MGDELTDLCTLEINTDPLKTSKFILCEQKYIEPPILSTTIEERDLIRKRPTAAVEVTTTGVVSPKKHKMSDTAPKNNNNGNDATETSTSSNPVPPSSNIPDKKSENENN